MATIGVLTLDLHIEHSQSLKDKRQVVRSLKDRLRSKFNVATAEIDGLDSWQRAVVGVVTVSAERPRAEEVLRQVEREAADLLGRDLVGAEVDFY